MSSKCHSRFIMARDRYALKLFISFNLRRDASLGDGSRDTCSVHYIAFLLDCHDWGIRGLLRRAHEVVFCTITYSISQGIGRHYFDLAGKELYFLSFITFTDK